MRDNLRFGIFGLLFLGGILLLIYSFLIWRFDFSLFGFMNYKLYVWYGIGATVLPILLYIWGFTIGLYVSGGSLLIAGGLFLFGVLLDKNNEYDPSSELITCMIALGIGLVAMFFGSEEEHEQREAYSNAKWDHDHSNVVCAQCDQFLGRAQSFTSPCPRCGSNRYEVQ